GSGVRFSIIGRLVRSSSCTESADHRADGSKGDQQVEPKGAVLDVVKVVMQLASRRLDLRDVALIDLRPAADPGPHDVTVAVEMNPALVPIGELTRLRAGTDPAHLAAKDVEHLGQFVDAIATKNPADARDPRVVVRCKGGLHGRADPHGAKLEDRKFAAVE